MPIHIVRSAPSKSIGEKFEDEMILSIVVAGIVDGLVLSCSDCKSWSWVSNLQFCPSIRDGKNQKNRADNCPIEE
jgi:hypothetical protein